MKDLKILIDEHDIISFDIFDTLIIRDFSNPIDVFKYIEDNFKVTDFQIKRIKAEVMTRSNNFNLADISYKTIYNELTEVDPNLELNIELQSCVENVNLKQIYDYALSQNKHLIAISDMYLEENFIRQLLVKNGFSSIEKIYVSGNLNKTKGNGQIYEYVLEDLEIKPSQLIHIGDNYQSDYIKAKEKGITSFHYKSLRDQLSENSNEYLLTKLKQHNSSPASLFAGLLANKSMQKSKHEYWYQFGFTYAGILIFHFMNHIYDYCKANKISRIYFMARDGKIMQEVFDTLYSHDNSIKTHYMLASRRLFFVPSIKDLDDKTLQALIESSYGTPYIDIINRLGFDWLVNKAKEHFENIHKPITRQTDREALKQFFLLYKDKILNETSEERNNLLAYLEDIGFSNDNNRLIVDVGWGCSSQKYLESIVQDKIHGIYYGTHESTYTHELMHGYIFNKGFPKKEKDLVFSSLPVVELLFVGNHYSIVKLDNNLNPVYHNESREEQQRIDIASDIHNGILDFVNDYQQLLTKYRLLPDYSLNTLVLTALLIKPSIQDILHISKIQHAAAFGESSYEPIIKNLDQTQREFLKNALLGKMLKNSSLWPKGKLRYKQLLQKKHYRSIELLSLIITKIQHCYSYSFQICTKKIIQKLFKR